MHLLNTVQQCWQAYYEVKGSKNEYCHSKGLYRPTSHSVKYKDIVEQFFELRQRIGEHDVQLNQIYDAIENLLDEKTEQKSWKNRERIGFKSK